MAVGMLVARSFVSGGPARLPPPPASGDTQAAGYIDDIVAAPDRRAEPARPSPPPPLPAQQPTPAVTAVAAPPQQSQPPPPRRQTIAVDSTAPGSAYPLAEWHRMSVAGGWLDSIEIDGRVFAPGVAAAVRPDQVIIARGWTGDASLGLRMPFVLLTVCDTVVASVPVSMSRPDVAKVVHPNLERSGWVARLFAGDLLRCDGAELRAYGVAPFRRIVFPLSGQYPLRFEAATAPAVFDVQASLSALRPEAIPETAPSAALSIQAASVNLRRCGDQTCAIVGSLKAGQHAVTILEQSADWLLVSSSGGTGWMARRLGRISPAGNSGNR